MIRKTANFDCLSYVAHRKYKKLSILCSIVMFSYREISFYFNWYMSAIVMI